MLGPGWHEGTGSASVNRPGAGGQQIHGGPFYGRAHGYYFDPVEGRPHSIQVNFAWCLRDVNLGDGERSVLLKRACTNEITLAAKCCTITSTKIMNVCVCVCVCVAAIPLLLLLS